MYDLDETKANIHFQQFWWDSRASGYDQLSFKFAFYFSCHIKMIIMKEIGIYFYGVKILLH